MDGVSTRFAFKALSATFNHEPSEITADPVHLMYVLERMVRQEQLPGETETRYLEFIKGDLAPPYAEFIGNEIQKAYLDSYHDYAQNLFDRNVASAVAWIADLDSTDPDTAQLSDREATHPDHPTTKTPPT